MERVVELTKQLIALPSVTPEDKGCQTLIAKHLQGLGFTVERLPHGKVDNLWALRGDSGPLFVFAGHTDVVAVGDSADWQTDPFQAEVIDGKLYGRGAADMKGSLAAMLCACENYCADQTNSNVRIGFLITSGEEGHDFLDGTPKVMEFLQAQGIKIDYCIVGEPSCNKKLGDTIRNGRRGSLSGFLSIKGQQAHVAYCEPHANPIHQATAVLSELAQTKWDQGNQHFPPTCFHITELQAGDGSSNVVPAHVKVQFNFRYSTEVTAQQLKEHVERSLAQHKLNVDLTWRHNGEPFITEQGELLSLTQHAIKTVTGIEPQLSTSGGTSDARFIAPYGVQVIEFGPCNGTIHKANEHVTLAELHQLVLVYQEMLTGITRIGIY